MLLAKKIRSLLNGGGSAAGVRGLREAIDTLEAEMKAHRDELEEIPRKRGEAALVDDAEKELAALTVREDHLYAAIEVAQHRVAALRDRLDELTASDRQADFSKRRDAIIEASVAAAAALREANEKFAKMIELREAARADGFERDVNSIPLLPYIVNLADPAPALDPFELAMDRYRQRRPDAVAVPASRQPSGPKFAPGSYGGNAYLERHERTSKSLSHPVVLVPGSSTAMPDAESPAVILTGKDGAPLQRRVLPHEAPPQKRQADDPRPPLPDVSPAGTVRCRVIASGYTDAAGQQYPEGAFLDVKESDARAAASRGRIEIMHSPTGLDQKTSAANLRSEP